MWIVQKYIEAPTLVHGRKFDIRQFAMVTPDGAVHMYRDSYVRTCSAEYDVDNLDVKAIHLTNDAVQKVLDSYGVGAFFIDYLFYYRLAHWLTLDLKTVFS